MKPWRLILILTCTIMIGGLSFGQETKPSTDLKQKIKTFKNSKRFAVDYDKFKDETHVHVGPFFTMPLGMSAHFFFKGQTVQEDIDKIYLTFHSYSSDWRFLNDRTLYAIIDGERTELRDADRSSDISLGSVSETLIYTLPTDTFRKIAEAKTIQLRVGSVEVKVKDEHQIAFKDLLTLTKRE